MATCSVGSTFIVEIEQTSNAVQTNFVENSDLMRTGLTVQAIQIQVITAAAGNIDVQRGSDGGGWTTMLSSVQATNSTGIFCQNLNNYALDSTQGLRVVNSAASKCIVRFICSQFTDRPVDVNTT